MEKIVWLFPLIFIFHDMEEIVGARFFLRKNRSLLEEKFPRFISMFKDFSTEGFALAVYEELILCIALSAVLAITNNDIVFDLWLGGFIGCALHFLVHIIQSVILKTYIPALITSIICLPISIYLIIWSIGNIFEPSYSSAIFAAAGVALVAANLALAQKMIGWFTRKMENERRNSLD